MAHGLPASMHSGSARIVDALAEKTLSYATLSTAFICAHFSALIYRSADQYQQMCLTVSLFSADVKKRPLS